MLNPNGLEKCLKVFVCLMSSGVRRMETVPLQREAETQWSRQKPLVSAAWVLSLE